MLQFLLKLEHINIILSTSSCEINWIPHTQPSIATKYLLTEIIGETGKFHAYESHNTKENCYVKLLYGVECDTKTARYKSEENVMAEFSRLNHLLSLTAAKSLKLNKFKDDGLI